VGACQIGGDAAEHASGAAGPPEGPSDVVLAERKDFGRLAGLLRRAFDDEPVQRWLFPTSWRRHAASELWFRGMLHDARRCGRVERLRDFSSVAVWCAPGAPRDHGGLMPALFHVMVVSDRRAARRKAELDGALAERRPAAPHWYLAALATELQTRQQGRGRKVLAPTLAACDREGVRAYLETSEPRSIPFYERLGFRTASLLRLANGPSVWTMVREPATWALTGAREWATAPTP
jgi:GNAT superfamily N-acetyltransferase